MIALKPASACAALTLSILIAGCGKSGPAGNEAAGTTDQPATAEANPSEVQPTAATTPAGQQDDQVKPAVATAPASRLTRDPNEPAPLPAGPETPLGDADADGPLPLEEAIDSGTSMPQVVLTEDHAKTCLVRVGDLFPKLELSDLAGQPRSMGELVGDKLTIVVFWNAKLPTSLEELHDMQSRFLKEFGPEGVSVIGVNVGDDPRLAGELVEQAGAQFVNLSDRSGTALAKLATRKLPRTYLVDASGKVLWLDLEYSRSTRQQLLSAMRFALKSE